MNRFGGHVIFNAAIGGLLMTPLLLPYSKLVTESSAFRVWYEADRILSLARVSAGLAAGTMIIVLPLGTLAAFALVASTRRWQKVNQSLLLLGLVLPLPVTTVAWHALRLGWWSPFSQGLIPAAVLHALAALPWVVIIVAVGLSSRDRGVCDDARLHAGPIRRALFITLPSIRGFLALSALWIFAQTAGEIVVTDMLQVRTFAEEVYTQVVAPAAETNAAAEIAVARAVAASLPMPIALVGLFIITRRWLGRQPHLELSAKFSTTSSALAGLFVTSLAVSVIAVPLLSLVFRCCRRQDGFSTLSGADRLGVAIHHNASMLCNSVMAAFVTSVTVTVLAGVLAALGRSNRWYRALLLIVAALAAAIPAPLIGLGVRASIEYLLCCEERFGLTTLRGLLYDGPSLVPVAWTWAIRSWPLAAAIGWPAISRLPTDFAEATRMDTGSGWAVIRHDWLPMIIRPFVASLALILTFCLGEVSASRLVTTPGGQSFAHDVFARMHFGITPDLAAMCLVLVAVIGGCCMTVCGLKKLPRLGSSGF